MVRPIILKSIEAVTKSITKGAPTMPIRWSSSAVGAHVHGPLATMDDMPVPFKPYQQVHDELNAKWNKMLAAGVVILGSVITLCYVDNTMETDATAAPASYRNKTPIQVPPPL